jgi:hypothetical protein
MANRRCKRVKIDFPEFVARKQSEHTPGLCDAALVGNRDADEDAAAAAELGGAILKADEAKSRRMLTAHSERGSGIPRRTGDDGRLAEARPGGSTSPGGEKHRHDNGKSCNEQLKRPTHVSISLEMRKLAPSRSRSLPAWSFPAFPPVSSI